MLVDENSEREGVGKKEEHCVKFSARMVALPFFNLA